jgi:hypothetical protein
MPDPAGLRTGHAIADAGRFLDAMPVARHVPFATLASCLGIPQDVSDRVASLVGRLCDASAPSLLPRQPAGGLGEVTDELAAISAVACGSAAAGEAAVGLMFQRLSAGTPRCRPPPGAAPALRIRRCLPGSSSRLGN